MDFVGAWERARYRLSMADATARPLEVDGITMVEAPWIGLHIGPAASVDVTHVPSGKRIGGFASLGSALEFAARIAYLLEWKVIEPVISADHARALEEARRDVDASAFAPRTTA